MSKTTKAFRKQARTAERVAYQSGDAFISGQMKRWRTHFVLRLML
jgi:hypothetical protein